MEMHARARLLGTWELIEGKLLNDGVASDYEFSPQRGGGGILIYSPDRYMCATLSKRERARFSTDQNDGGTAEEKVEAYPSRLCSLAPTRSSSDLQAARPRMTPGNFKS
jgi:hypothetical protein